MLGFAPIASGPLADDVSGSGEAYSLTANSGSFAATGQAVTLNKALRLDAQSRVFTLSLQGAAKLITEFVPDGQFAASGQEINFGRSVAFGAGSFALTGQDASKQLSHVFNAGAFDLSEQEINFGFSFTALAGSFTYAGQSFNELISEAVGAGSFALSHQDASLKVQRVRAAESGVFSVSYYGIQVKGFLSPALPSKVYVEQSLAAISYNDQTLSAKAWEDAADANAPAYVDATDTSPKNWEDAA